MSARRSRVVCLVGLALLIAAVTGALVRFSSRQAASANRDEPPPRYQPRKTLDPGGFQVLVGSVRPWVPGTGLDTISDRWHRAGSRQIEALNRALGSPALSDQDRL